jgi:hypothetical protein
MGELGGEGWGFGEGGAAGGADRFLAELARWAGAERVAQSASERARLRALVDSSAASATWAGLLLDLAESAAEVVCTVSGGARLAGRLVGVARDFVVVERGGAGVGPPLLVRIDAIGAITPAGGAARQPAGDRSAPLGITFSTALDALAGEGSPVTLRAADEAFTGTVTACGTDVVTLRLEGMARRTVHLPLDAVMWVELR